MPHIEKAGSILLLITLVTVAACAPKGKKIQDYAINANISGLKLDKSQAPTLLYTRPEAPSLAAYNRFIIDPVQVIYTDPQMKELKPEQVGEMQAYFRDDMIKEFRDGGYEVGTRSQSGTLRISLTISGLKASSGVVPPTLRR